MTRKQKRLTVIGGALGFLGLATALVFYALGQKTSYFYMPADLQQATVEPGERIRLGGLVEKGTIVRGQGGKRPSLVPKNGSGPSTTSHSSRSVSPLKTTIPRFPARFSPREFLRSRRIEEPRTLW